MLSSLFLLVVIMLPFYIRFERKAFVSREIVLVAVLAAIAAVSRVPFSILPSVQPTSFVIIVSAIVFGSETGFMIGATAAIVSNIFLGQGPWTPWQMFSWGMIGFIAGLLRNTFLMKKLWGKTTIRIVCWIFIWLDHEFLGASRFYTRGNVGNSHFVLYRKFLFRFEPCNFECCVLAII